MKKLVCIVLCLCACAGILAQGHPRIYASASDKEAIRKKIADEEWAGNVYSRLKEKIDPYVERHLNDPEWIVSRLAMYWKDGERYTQCYLKKQNWERGEGNAPVPTVRMPGMRTWNRYVNVPLEERTPYNETGDMWGISRTDPDAPKVLVPYKETGHMIRSNNAEILTLAEEAAFLYWVTDKEAYARFAADIFNVWLAGTYYMSPALDPDRSTGGPGGYEPGGICGYYDYEQIHDDLAMHAAVAYDFAYDYLKEHPHPHLADIGKTTDEVAGIVFKRFVDIGMVRGGKSGNWNVNGWNVMLFPILALEENDAYPDGKGRSYYLHFLTRESTAHHDAIPDILKGYDPITGLWPESPGYAFGVTGILLDFATLLRRQGVDIIADNPLLRKSAMAVFPWMDSRARIIVFGDYRGGTANFRTFENLLAYYTEVGDGENASRAAAALNAGIEAGAYDRGEAGWTALCSFVPEIPDAEDALKERTSYSPFHRLVTMRNELEDDELLAVIYGGRSGSHLSPNGLALQLYGFGYALSPDAAAYESYWSEDHKYHQSATGSNTVLPGYTDGEIRIHALDPEVDSTSSLVNARALNPYINVCDMEAGDKRRTVAVVKTGDNVGYYVDIFRSDQPESDYLFHNVGTSLEFSDAGGRRLPLEKVGSLGRTYAKGYEWFTNPEAVSFSGGFKAVWNVCPSLSMQMWMTGAEGRDLYRVDAPYTTLSEGLTPMNVSMAPSVTPTLIVRQRNNAWKSPFMAVFQPVKGGKPSVSSVERLEADSLRAGVCISSEGGRKDYVLSSVSSDAGFSGAEGIRFRGTFGLVTDVRGKTSQLYMVRAKEIGHGACSLRAESPVSASVFLKDGKWFYSSDGKVEIRIGGKVYVVGEGCGLPLE